MDDFWAAADAEGLYVNLHTSEYPAGAVRGQLEPLEGGWVGRGWGGVCGGWVGGCVGVVGGWWGGDEGCRVAVTAGTYACLGCVWSEAPAQAPRAASWRPWRVGGGSMQGTRRA